MKNNTPKEPISWSAIQSLPEDSPEGVQYAAICSEIAARLNKRPAQVLGAVYRCLHPDLGRKRSAHAEPRTWNEHARYLYTVAARELEKSYKEIPPPSHCSMDKVISGTEGTTFGETIPEPAPHDLSEEQAFEQIKDFLDGLLYSMNSPKRVAIVSNALDRLTKKNAQQTQQEIAVIAGCNQSTVARILKDMAGQYRARYR